MYWDQIEDLGCVENVHTSVHMLLLMIKTRWPIKDALYVELQEVVDKVPLGDKLFVM